MDQLKAMRTFVSVCDKEGFSTAGAALGVSKAVVSKRISELEDHLGCRLLQRTTRQIYLTHCRDILEEIGRTESELGCKAIRPEGRLRVNAPLSYGQKFIAPLIAPFLESYPEIAVELTLTDRFVDLIEEGVDMAIRVGGDRSSTLIARVLGYVYHGFYASPDYVAKFGMPTSSADLKNHRFLGYGDFANPRPCRFDGRTITMNPILATNNGEILRQAAIDGLGIAPLPDFIVGDAVINGELVCIGARDAEDPAPVMAVYPVREHLPQKVRVFIDFLVERLENASRHAAPVSVPDGR